MLYSITAKFLYILLLSELTSTNIIPNIYKSENAVLGQFPALVALKILIRRTVGLCGGTLIDLSHIITAGHCLEKVAKISDGGKITAIGDEISLWVESPSRQERDAIFFIIHPKYFRNGTDLFNDIAIIQVNQLYPFRLLFISLSKQVYPPFTPTRTLYPVPRSVQKPPKNTKCSLAGYGEMDLVSKLT